MLAANEAAVLLPASSHLPLWTLAPRILIGQTKPAQGQQQTRTQKHNKPVRRVSRNSGPDTASSLQTVNTCEAFHTPLGPHTPPRPGQYQFFSLAPAPRDTQAGRQASSPPKFSKIVIPNNFARSPRPSPPILHPPPTTFLNSPDHAKTLQTEPPPHLEIPRIRQQRTRQFYLFRISTPQNINNGRRKGKVRGRKELGRQDGDGRGPQEAAEPLGEGRSPGKRRPCLPLPPIMPRRDFLGGFSRSLLFRRAITTHPEYGHLDASESSDTGRDPPRWPTLVGASSSIASMARHQGAPFRSPPRHPGNRDSRSIIPPRNRNLSPDADHPVTTAADLPPM